MAFITNSQLPPLDALPPVVADIAAPAADALERYRELQRRHAEAKRKLAAAETTMKQAYAAAARDPEAKVPTDRRPALAEEVRVAAQLERQAKTEAKNAWHRMSARLTALDPSVATSMDDGADEARQEYEAAIAHLEQTRTAYYEATAVRRWVEASTGIHPDRSRDATANSYRVEVPPSISPAAPGAGRVPVPFADLLDVLRTEATQEVGARDDARRQRFMRLNPERVTEARERAAKAEQDETRRLASA